MWHEWQGWQEDGRPGGKRTAGRVAGGRQVGRQGAGRRACSKELISKISKPYMSSTPRVSHLPSAGLMAWLICPTSERKRRAYNALAKACATRGCSLATRGYSLATRGYASEYMHMHMHMHMHVHMHTHMRLQRSWPGPA